MSSIVHKKARKIAVIELEAHPHFVDFLSNLFVDENVTFYFSHSFFKNQIENQFKISGRIVIQEPEESLVDFIEKNLATVNTMDLIIISTATKSKAVLTNYKIVLNGKILLNIHNINEWFKLNMLHAFKYYLSTEKKEIKLKKNIKIDQKGPLLKVNIEINKNIMMLRVYRAVKNCFKLYREKKQNKVILNKVKYLNVFHPAMKEELDNRFDLSQRYIVTTLPYRYPVAYSKDMEDKDYLCIGILGKVKASRDYVGLIRALSEYSCKRPKKIMLYILGAYKDAEYKKKVERLIKNIECDNLIIKKMPGEKRLSQVEIDNLMKEISMILSPVAVNDIDRKSVEIYGRTRASGTDFDAIYYGKPLLIPSWYNPVPYLNDMYILYDNYEHLNELISKYMDYNLLLNKTRKVREIMEKYTWDHIRKNFFKQIFE